LSEDRVSAIMAAMTERRIRHIPVVDRHGRLCGIVSIGDLVKHRLDEIQREADAMREYISGTR
jgi:CBS domain-containing protein